MSHYAKVVGGVVVSVIVADEEFIASIGTADGEWLQTSYNIRGGVYYDPETSMPIQDQSIIALSPGRQRKNYAGIGYTYDAQLDAFIPPQPFASWTLNEESCLWEPPVPYPSDGAAYVWDEPTTSWIPE